MVALMGYDTVTKRGRWLERAKSGDVYSQYELAESYCCGVGEGTHNAEEAMKWWCESARNGYALSQLRLGTIYENKQVMVGLPITQDLPKAYMWYKLAARRGNEDARNNLISLESTMNKKQISEAEKLLKKWKQLPCEIN